MNYLRLVGIAVLFVLVGLGTVGGCGSSGGGADSGCCVHFEPFPPVFCTHTSNKAVCDNLVGIFMKGVMCVDVPECGIVPPPAIVPNSLVITEGSSLNSIPLSCSASSTMRYQQVYLASEFGSISCNINEIRFRTDASGPAGPNMRTQNDVAIQFSTTSVSPMTLSSTYANNIGSDVTNVFSGSLAFDISPPCGLPGPCPFDTIINLQTPFPYNPSMGNLLLDISLANCTGDITNQNFWDATGGAITVMNRLFNFDVNAPTGNIDGGRGLVTQFVCE